MAEVSIEFSNNPVHSGIDLHRPDCPNYVTYSTLSILVVKAKAPDTPSMSMTNALSPAVME